MRADQNLRWFYIGLCVESRARYSSYIHDGLDSFFLKLFSYICLMVLKRGMILLLIWTYSQYCFLLDSFWLVCNAHNVIWLISVLLHLGFRLSLSNFITIWPYMKSIAHSVYVITILSSLLSMTNWLMLDFHLCDFKKGILKVTFSWRHLNFFQAWILVQIRYFP
jgi:hypothetical protein